MKKILIGVIISMIMLVSVISSANVVEIKKEKNNFGEISIEIPIGSYEIKNTENGDEIYLEDFGILFTPGKPNLPSKIFSIAIPPGAEPIDVKFERGEGITLDGGFNINPVDLPRVIGQEKPEVYQQEVAKYNENYNSVYGSNDPYPSQNVEFERTSGYRHFNLVDVRVNPFTYKPVSKELIFYPDILVKVTYSYKNGNFPQKVISNNNQRTEEFTEQFVLNYDQTKNWYETGKGSRDSYDYVIITLDSLESSITDLVNWEEAKGRNVYVATTDWISSNYNGYDLAEKMRNFLRDKYPDDSWGILDVCIIGDWDDVPMRLTAQNTGYGRPETDFYFAELSLPDSQSWDADGDHQYGESSDPIDMYAEVNVGRIPWSNPSIVEDICEKSIAYEENDDDSFKKNILLLGAFFWPDTDNAELMEYKTDDSIHPWMSDWTMTKLYEDAQSSYPCDYDLTYDNVESVWSQGTFAFVDWAGHGSPTACYEYYPSQAFVDTDMCNELNDAYPAIIFADACSNSDTDEDNIGKMMLKQGGVGFLGATKVAYGMHAWDDPYDGSSQSLDYFFTTCCTSGDYTQGEAQQYGLVEMYQNDLWYYTKYETFQWGALWGNPGLTMGEVITSDPPETPNAPDGPDEWIINVDCAFEAVTTEPDGEDVYYQFNWGDGKISDWLGPYPPGQTIQADHVWSALGDYEILVHAKDTWGSKSNWSEPKILSIVEDEPPERPEIAGSKIVFAGREYKFAFTSTDPEGHDVYYKVDWDDGEGTDWQGPYSSGESMVLDHAWATKGEYFIKAWAKDALGKESSQGWLKINVMKTRTRNIQLINLLARLLETRPILARILDLI